MRVVGLVLRHALQLSRGFGIALCIEQDTGINHADFRKRLDAAVLVIQIFLGQCFGLRHFRIHQFKRQHGRAFSARIHGLSAPGRVKCAQVVASGQTHAPNRCPGDTADCRLDKVISQGGFHHAAGQLAVAGAGISTRQRVNCGTAVCIGHHLEFSFQRLQRVANAVQGNQYLQHIAVCIAGRRYILFPGEGRLQRRIAGTCLQCNFGRALVKLHIAGFSGGVQQQ